MNHKFKLLWRLSDLKNTPKNGRTVFSCFHCGGGSTMGYKLAGYDVLGGVEIDPEMMSIYRANHNPKHSYLMGVQDFNLLSDETIPAELFNLDILDGSPPCSSFSMAGSRESSWGKETYFREGQAKQVLDDLFFHFIALTKKLKPKVVIAENVKGLMTGNARYYVKLIKQAFEESGYTVQFFLLNAAFMGVPQRRERTFFIARRSDLEWKDLSLSFNETPILFEEIDDGSAIDLKGVTLTPTAAKYWFKCPPGSSFSKVHEKKSFFNWIKVHPKKPLATLASTAGAFVFHHSQPRRLTNMEWIKGQSFPLDYNFLKTNPKYVCGMSVPPIMMAQISSEINRQWFNP